MTQHLLGSLGLYGATLLVCFASGLIPLINAELYLVGATTLAVHSSSQLPALVVCAAIGQMTAKCLLYGAGMGMLELPRGRWKEKIERARAKLATWRKRPYLIYAVSSTVGLPPFYLVSLAAGALKIRFRPFCAIGLTGRIVRFGVVVAIPWIAAHGGSL